MKRGILGAVFLALSFFPGEAAVLHESATFSDSNPGGWLVTENIYLASRFTLSQGANITALGFGIRTTGTVFAAIIPLSSPTETPSYPGTELSSHVLASTVFDSPDGTMDFRTPLSIFLNAGSYGLVLGSGLFGATGFGLMGHENPGTALPDASYFFANLLSPTGEFRDTDLLHTRFVVEGDFVTPTPLPGALTLFTSGLGVISISAMAWRRKRKSVPAG